MALTVPSCSAAAGESSMSLFIDLLADKGKLFKVLLISVSSGQSSSWCFAPQDPLVFFFCQSGSVVQLYLDGFKVYSGGKSNCESVYNLCKLYYL